MLVGGSDTRRTICRHLLEEGQMQAEVEKWICLAILRQKIPPQGIVGVVEQGVILGVRPNDSGDLALQWLERHTLPGLAPGVEEIAAHTVAVLGEHGLSYRSRFAGEVGLNPR
jgi:hypothetical protein